MYLVFGQVIRKSKKGCYEMDTNYTNIVVVNPVYKQINTHIHKMCPNTINLALISLTRRDNHVRLSTIIFVVIQQ